MTLPQAPIETIEGIVDPLRTQHDFSEWLKVNVDLNRHKEGGRYKDPSDFVKLIYRYVLSHKGWGRKRNSFENAVVALLANPENHSTEIQDGNALGDIIWYGTRDGIRSSLSRANGRLARKVMQEINLEAIASGELCHTNVQGSDWRLPINQSPPEYRAQRILTNLLFSVQQKNLPGLEYWERIASNPSFVEIAYRLAFVKGDQPNKGMLLEVLKFYREMFKGMYAIANFEQFVRRYSPLIQESVVKKRMESLDKSTLEQWRQERRREFGLLSQFYWAALTATGGDSVVIMTGTSREGDTVSYEYLKVDDNGIHRGLTATYELKPINRRSVILEGGLELPTFYLSTIDDSGLPVNPKIPPGMSPDPRSVQPPEAGIDILFLAPKVDRFQELYNAMNKRAA